MSDTNQRIADIVGGKDVVLFMKGTPLFPQCGFSSRARGLTGPVSREGIARVAEARAARPSALDAESSTVMRGSPASRPLFATTPSRTAVSPGQIEATICRAD